VAEHAVAGEDRLAATEEDRLDHEAVFVDQIVLNELAGERRAPHSTGRPGARRLEKGVHSPRSIRYEFPDGTFSLSRLKSFKLPVEAYTE
jgi:hypothetical protein